MENAKAVARYIVQYSEEKEYFMNNLKLQKILFFAQRYYLHKYRMPLFADDIQAWAFGPVVSDVYRMYSQFGGMAIPADKVDVKQDILALRSSLSPQYSIDEWNARNIRDIVDEFAKDSTTSLTEMSKNTASYRNSYIHGCHAIISKACILKDVENVA